MLQWIDDAPEGDNLRVIITVLKKVKASESEESIEDLLKRSRGIVTPRKTKDEIDRDILEMRAEWNRKWEKILSYLAICQQSKLLL